ncbi:MAG: type II secretion system F family protein [Tepidiphilus sp.]|jgi:type IV pilus assembly protein PilC|uniref:Type II secretory pathway, component PulF n=1 Tax=Tepidiphilus thermophilus TaxID=876478 RepID=A0A0K6IW12_9PROT|nr:MULTISPECIES: type II secretion system F family protein [Tepidiphilus]MBP6998911.1 type II secretion system F family protein [Tepidiphilus sp.]CUB07527.1 Type II secretory pathway, component PulF [Tepidiphilus thermophilus]
MATTTAKPKELLFSWEGKDAQNKPARGEIRAPSEASARTALRRQGVVVTKITKIKQRRGRVGEKDLVLFTRQLSTMMKAGVPLLQSFDIAIKGSTNPALTRLLNLIREDIAAGSSLAAAFAKYPMYFDRLFVSLVAAGEQAGILDDLLERLASYQEKILAIKGKIKSALFYPTAVVVVAMLVIAVMMIFVIPQFKDIFTSFGADLPAPTQIVIDLSEFFVANWYYMLVAVILLVVGFGMLHRRSPAFRALLDRMILRIPVIGDIIRKATIARWTRTLATMFAAGVPLNEALVSVGDAAGNIVYREATEKITQAVTSGISLTVAMTDSGVFPAMVTQMVSIGEESGQLDAMLSKVAEYYEREVDEAVASLSQLLEPIIMVFLGVVIGGIVVAMYLPIFKMAQTI